MFFDSGQNLGNSSSYGIALGDLDGDGDLDAFVANYNDEVNRIYRNDGSGSFSGADATSDTHVSYYVALGDLDGQ